MLNVNKLLLLLNSIYCNVIAQSLVSPITGYGTKCTKFALTKVVLPFQKILNSKFKLRIDINLYEPCTARL